MQARSFFIALLIAFSVHDTCAMKRKHETEDLYSADTPPTLTLPYKLSNRDIFNAAQTNDYGQFLHIFGSFYLQVDKQSEALQCWKKDVKKYQGAKRSAANVGMVYGSLDNLPKAKKYFELAIKSGDKKTMHNLALIYERENNHVMAKQCYKQSITSCTENTPLSAHNLAVSFREKNNIKKAKKYYHLAADKYNFALSCNDLALIYEQENNHALATQYYAKIAEVNPHAATQAGILYYKQKKN